MEPVLQVALDFNELSRALKAGREAVAGGAQWIEAAEKAGGRSRREAMFLGPIRAGASRLKRLFPFDSPFSMMTDHS